MDAGRGPHAEAQARTSTAGKKERGIKTNKSQGEEVGEGAGVTKTSAGAWSYPTPL